MIVRTPWTGLITVVPVGGAATLLHLLPHLVPAGLPREGVRIHERLLHIPPDGMSLATFDSRELLITNEGLRVHGRQRAVVTCLLLDEAAPAFAAAVAHISPDQEGRRDLWVRMSAETRLASGPCQQRHDPQYKQRWGA